ncbi:hypothetical protein HDR61_01635 [bacterium]|nr:hypothetical protein [bacterium]
MATFTIKPATSTTPKQVIIIGAEDMLSPSEVVRIVGVSLKTLRKWRELRINLAFCECDRSAKYPASAINEYLAATFCSVIIKKA